MKSPQNLLLKRAVVRQRPLPPLPDRFGIRSPAQIARDLGEVARGSFGRGRFQFDVRSAGLLRPDLSLAAYAGFVPSDGRAPIFNLFDRVGGGVRYTQRVSRRTARDFRGGRLSYDEHDGTDLVCPIGTPLVAAAPGTVVMIRDRWLRGGLTLAVDHGHGIVTQYTHCAKAIAALGAVVKRGEPIAISGAAGFDMVQFFPWIPPHVHFMVYVDGAPVDPFLAQGEARRPGIWLDPADPAPSGPRPEDPESPMLSAVDDDAIAHATERCTDARIRGELSAIVAAFPPGSAIVKACLAALLEDALAHDSWAWPSGDRIGGVRAPSDPARASKIAITVPLPADAYTGIRFSDAPWTAPAADEGQVA